MSRLRKTGVFKGRQILGAGCSDEVGTTDRLPVGRDQSNRGKEERKRQRGGQTQLTLFQKGHGIFGQFKSMSEIDFL
jgi:hypothetical protein